MDIEIQALLQRIKEAGRAPFWQGTPETARSTPTLMRLLFGDAPKVHRTQDLTIPSSGGHRLPLRVYMPSERPKGIIVYFHGGGWVIGSVADYHPFTAALAQRSGCAVVSVDYRLAPEHPFPAPLEDAVSALDWVAGAAADELGFEPAALIAIGDSAGANLATVAARLHKQNGVKRQVDLQVLAYPVTDADFETNSYKEFAEGNLLTRNDMKWFWNHYCADQQLRRNPNASPLHASDLHGSAPALILTAERDPLRDEGESYARRLMEAGVPVELIRCGGLVHGFLAMINYAPSAGAAFDRILKAIDKTTATRSIKVQAN